MSKLSTSHRSVVHKRQSHARYIVREGSVEHTAIGCYRLDGKWPSFYLAMLGEDEKNVPSHMWEAVEGGQP